MKLIQKIKAQVKALAFGTVLVTALAGTASATPSTFGRIAGYYDTRGRPTATVTAGASELPLGINAFSFLDFATERDNLDNLIAPYGEIRFSRKADFGLGVAIEYNRDFSMEDGTTRIGFVFEPNLRVFLPHTFVGAKFYPVSTHDHGMQSGIYGGTHLLGGNLTLDGFLDYNFNAEKVVAELQAGYRIANDFYGVLEGRYNGFLPENQRVGAGVGLEWRF